MLLVGDRELEELHGGGAFAHVSRWLSLSLNSVSEHVSRANCPSLGSVLHMDLWMLQKKANTQIYNILYGLILAFVVLFVFLFIISFIFIVLLILFLFISIFFIFSFVVLF